jgi:hypothetical protein
MNVNISVTNFENFEIIAFALYNSNFRIVIIDITSRNWLSKISASLTSSFCAR